MHHADQAACGSEMKKGEGTLVIIGDTFQNLILKLETFDTFDTSDISVYTIRDGYWISSPG